MFDGRDIHLRKMQKWTYVSSRRCVLESQFSDGGVGGGLLYSRHLAGTVAVAVLVSSLRQTVNIDHQKRKGKKKMG